jgi:hypothetical protein
MAEQVVLKTMTAVVNPTNGFLTVFGVSLDGTAYQFTGQGWQALPMEKITPGAPPAPTLTAA